MITVRQNDTIQKTRNKRRSKIKIKHLIIRGAVVCPYVCLYEWKWIYDSIYWTICKYNITVVLCYVKATFNLFLSVCQPNETLKAYFWFMGINENYCFVIYTFFNNIIYRKYTHIVYVFNVLYSYIIIIFSIEILLN